MGFGDAVKPVRRLEIRRRNTIRSLAVLVWIAVIAAVLPAAGAATHKVIFDTDFLMPPQDDGSALVLALNSPGRDRSRWHHDRRGQPQPGNRGRARASTARNHRARRDSGLRRSPPSLSQPQQERLHGRRMGQMVVDRSCRGTHRWFCHQEKASRYRWGGLHRQDRDGEPA